MSVIQTLYLSLKLYLYFDYYHSKYMEKMGYRKCDMGIHICICICISNCFFSSVFVFDLQLYMYSDLCHSGEWKGCRQRDIAIRDLDALCISIFVAATTHLSYSSAEIFLQVWQIFVCFLNVDPQNKPSIAQKNGPESISQSSQNWRALHFYFCCHHNSFVLLICSDFHRDMKNVRAFQNQLPI